VKQPSRELLQAPVASSAANDSGESRPASGAASGNTDSSDNGTPGAASPGDGSGQGDGQSSGAGNGNGSDSSGNGGDGTAGNGPGGSDSGDGGVQADQSQDAALQGYSKIYPKAARDAGEEGVAVVGVSVSAGGSVTRGLAGAEHRLRPAGPGGPESGLSVEFHTGPECSRGTHCSRIPGNRTVPAG
jgi:periplasmic protein TonB